MVHAKEKGKSARRVKEIFEVESVDAKSGEVKTRKIFEWDPATDTFKKINESNKVQKIVTSIGGKLEDALQEIKLRQKILEMFEQKGIKDYLEITKQINLYYKEPSKILDQMGDFAPQIKVPEEKISKEEVKTEIGKEISQKIQVQVDSLKKEIRKRISILNLFGMKEIRDKQ
jgi:hypothetical protein